MRIIIVSSGRNVVGVTPLYVDPTRLLVTYRMLGMPYEALKEPLAEPGAEAVVADMTAAALVAGDPVADALEIEGLPASSRWRGDLCSSRLGARLFDASPQAVPTVALGGEPFEAWMSAKSRNFRQQMRRARRRVEEAGGRFRLAATTQEMRQQVPVLLALHEARWRARGGSAVLRPGLPAMLVDASEALGIPDRARMWFIEIDGRTISAHLFIGCGGRSSYWLGGFDDSFAHLHPGLLCLLSEIERAIDSGQRVVDLGAGGHAYKRRLATEDVMITRSTFVFKGRGYVRRRAMTAPRELSANISTRLPDRWKDVLRHVRVPPTRPPAAEATGPSS